MMLSREPQERENGNLYDVNVRIQSEHDPFFSNLFHVYGALNVGVQSEETGHVM